MVERIVSILFRLVWLMYDSLLGSCTYTCCVIVCQVRMFQREVVASGVRWHRYHYDDC